MLSSKIEIVPSILSADFRCIEYEVKAVTEAGANRIHCDVMDGHFVPNLTFGTLIIEAVKKSTNLPLDVHLMIANPEKYIDDYCRAGANFLMIHAETCNDLGSTLEKMRSHGVKIGVAVNPDKPVDLFTDYLEKIDQVLIMTVFAGFGGQKFIPATMDKVRTIAEKASLLNRTIDIEVDGGINDKTIIDAVSNGANVFVTGSYVYGADDYKARINTLRKAAEKAVS